jgi:hypothetical protein
MIPSLALFLKTTDTKFLPPLIASEVITVAGLLVFAVSVYRELVRPRP